MPDVGFDNLFVVSAVALLVPLLLGFVPGLRVPSVVVEILAGVALGPTGLGWVRVDEVVAVLAVLVLGFLLFLAGLEIDVQALGGPALRSAGLGYVVTIALGLAAGLGLQAAGWVRSGPLVAVALSATSLGLVVPVLKDAGADHAPVGRLTVAAATVADFAAVVLLSLLFSATGSTGATTALLSAFAVLAVVVAVAVRRAGRSMRLGDVLLRLQDTTAQIRVRAAVVLLVGFVALAARFGIETILGAFVAGAVLATVDRDAASHPHLRTKLEAIGYGFLVPVFFVSSGLRLDLRGLFSDPAAALRVPVLLLALLLVRGLPALLFRRVLDGPATLAAALLQATSLPFVVAATQIGVATGAMSGVTAAAFVSAGVLSVLLFPAAALGLLRRGDAGAGRRDSTTVGGAVGGAARGAGAAP
ncbi:MAG: cation:proton antiporter [Actinobacteria bacterium]|nr:cation:proton antiporter [Actinomycetota bacterium]